MTTLKPGDWATYAPDSLDNVTGTWVARIGRTFLVVAGVTNDSRVVVYDDETGDMLYPRAESMKPAESPLLADTLTVPRELLASLVEDDDCWFDHHGGCQAHGYISLEPGEKCPQAELKELLAEDPTP